MLDTPPPPRSAVVRCGESCQHDCSTCESRRARASIKATVERLAPSPEVDRTRVLSVEEQAELRTRTESAIAARRLSPAALREQLRATVDRVTKSGAFKLPGASSA